MSIQKLFRQEVRSLPVQYKKTKLISDIAKEQGLLPIQILKLDAGENLWLPRRICTKLRKAMLKAAFAPYPDPDALVLRKKIARSLQVDPAWILVGNGSDELIDLCCRLFLNSGDTLIDFSPTFPMYWFFARIMGAKLMEVPRNERFEVDVPRAVEGLKKGKMAFLATPNNPTGTLTEREKILLLLATGKPLVVDEAYIEFGGESVVDLVSTFDNLIVLRTFSKWAGLAGVRVGFLIANPTVVEALRTIKPPYSVNTVAQAMATAALELKPDILPTIDRLKVSRDVFIKAANKISGIRAIPSKASCITLLLERDATDVANQLVRQGIVVKPLVLPQLPNALRVSIAPQTKMRVLVSALRKVCVIR